MGPRPHVKRLETMQTHPDTFFVIHEGQLVAWNYRTHDQFKIGLDHLSTLMKPEEARDETTIAELVEGGLLVSKPPQMRWDWDLLSRIFHIGTSATSIPGQTVNPTESARQYIDYCSAISTDMPADAFSYRRGEPVQVPAASPRKAPEALCQLLERRRTNRSFSGESIPLAQLLEVMSETFRYRDHELERYHSRGISTPTKRRSSPSAGSLQSCEAYLIAKKVEGLDPGVYHFWSDSDKLGRIKAVERDFSFGMMNAGQMFSDDLSASVIITCRFGKLSWKYAHSRAYRVALLDAGHLSQTLQLMATAVGLRTWVTGMFFDFDVQSLLDLSEDSQEFPLLSLGLGTGDFDPVDKNMAVRQWRLVREPIIQASESAVRFCPRFRCSYR